MSNDRSPKEPVPKPAELTTRLAADLARMAVVVEDAPAEAFSDDGVYVSAQRLLDLLDPLVNTAQRRRQLGDDL